MMNWKQAALGTCLLTGDLLTQSALADSQADNADKTFRAGIDYCNNAVRLSRTNTRQARAEFDQYLAHVDQARMLDPNLLQDNDYAAREVRFCAQVGDDIARAEALPVINKALNLCGQARGDLVSGKTQDARTHFNLYQDVRDRAIEKTETVLKVGTIAYQVRTCDDLASRIAAPEATVAAVQAPATKADHGGHLGPRTLVQAGSSDL